MASLLNQTFEHGNLVSESCLLRMCAMQQSLFVVNWQTGAHLAWRWPTLKLCSSRVCWSPFFSPDSIIIFWTLPWYSGNGLDSGMMVSFCLCCTSPFDLLISKALSVSGTNAAWADCYDSFTHFSPLIFLIYSLHAPTLCLLFLVYILISFYRLSFLSCAALLFMHSLMHRPAQSAY